MDDDIIIIDDPLPTPCQQQQQPKNAAQGGVTENVQLKPASDSETNQLNDGGTNQLKPSSSTDGQFAELSTSLDAPVVVQENVNVRTKHCLNKVCRVSEGLIQATSFTVSYFEKNPVEAKKYYVCEKCLQAAEDYEKKLVELLLNGETLMSHTIERPCDLVDLDLDDDEVDDMKLDAMEEEEDNPETFLIEGDVDQFIDDIFTKYNCEIQIEAGIRFLKDKLQHLEERRKTLEGLTNSLQKGIDELGKTFYGAFESRITHLPELDLNSIDQKPPQAAQNVSEANHKQTNHRNRSVFAAPRQKSYSKRLSADVIKQGADLASSLLRGKPETNPALGRSRPSTSEAPEIEAINQPKSQNKVKLPPSGPLERPVPQIGDFVFVMTVSLRDTWKKARVIAAEERDDAIFNIFDDGFAQYSVHSDVRVVCEQSPDVSNDIDIEARAFTQTYLKQYPERPMVKLQPGQIVKTEFNKRWYVARVQAVDASLAQLAFQNCEGRVEWIYRGSTRLSPLYNELVQRPKAQQKIQASSSTVADPTSTEQLKQDDHGGTVRAVAKKSTSKKPSQIVDESIERLERLPSRLKISSEHDGIVQSVKNIMPVSDIKFSRHQCGPPCIKLYHYDPENEPKWKRMNQLLIPMQLGWARKIVAIHLSSNRPKIPSDVVIYRAPCGRHLRSPEDVLRYLRVTHSNMPIDMFTFDIAVRTNVEFIPSKVLWEHADISYGKEPMPVSAVNSIDRTAPDYVAYSTVRIPSKGVKMNLDQHFLSCCSCKDDCQNRDKCECQQLTVKLFKTDKRGWGIRTLDDLPSGAFICIYAGKLLTDQEANQEGLTAGDEYFADLDFIEVAEKVKEGYESDVEMSDEEMDDPKGSDKDSASVAASVSVTSFSENTDTSLRRSARERKRPVNDNPEQPKKKKGRKGKKGKNQVFHSETADNDHRVKYVPTRELFGKDELAYTMDAKTVGNIGRYLNHSCNPNVFVQNVFVDTHDIRFPWVAFFANSHIAAGSELMWDYSYEVDSVPGKQLLCHCGAENCRGRLL